MKHYIILLLTLVCLLPLHAQSFVGDWMTVDDETGQNFSIVTIYQGEDGLYYGRVSRILMGPTDVVCEKCEGEDHNKPMQGLIIIRGMRLEKGELRGGRVLDPNNGKTYYAKLTIKDGKLVLRGSLDKAGILGRNQTWLPANN